MRLSVSVLDGAGAGLSGLCLVHCVALPMFAAAAPAIAGLAGAEWIHPALVIMAAPVAAQALLRPSHGLPPSPSIGAIGGAGLALLALGAFGPRSAETAASVGGGMSLASAHLLNWRRRSRRPRP